MNNLISYETFIKPVYNLNAANSNKKSNQSLRLSAWNELFNMLSDLVWFESSWNISLIRNIQVNSNCSNSSITMWYNHFKWWKYDEIISFIDSSSVHQINTKPWFYVWALRVLDSLR